MPSGDTPRAPRPGAPARSRARGRPTSHHVIAVLLGLAALVGLAVSGIVPGLLPSPTAEPPPGPTWALPSGTATAAAPGATGAARATPSASSSVPKRPLTLVGLGDSVPSAETCGCTGYVEQTGSRLQALTHRSWVVHNDAKGGWTTADVADDLNSARPATTSPAPTSCSSRWAPTTSTSTASMTAAASRLRGRPAGPRRWPDCATG